MNVTTVVPNIDSVDPGDSAGLQRELDHAMATLSDDGSYFARVRVHVYACTIYYKLHPEAPRHGGHRTPQTDTVAVCSSSARVWPTYTRYAAGLTGMSERSIRRDLEDGTKLFMASEECICKTPLANDRKTLLRVSALSAQQQADVATIYRASGPRNAKAKLAEYEAEAGIAPPTPRPAKPKPAPTEKALESAPRPSEEVQPPQPQPSEETASLHRELDVAKRKIAHLKAALEEAASHAARRVLEVKGLRHENERLLREVQELRQKLRVVAMVPYTGSVASPGEVEWDVDLEPIPHPSDRRGGEPADVSQSLRTQKSRKPRRLSIPKELTETSYDNGKPITISRTLTVKDALRTLGLKKSNSLQDLKRVYREKALTYHPDRRGPEEQEAAKLHMQRLNAARDVVKEYFSSSYGYFSPAGKFYRVKYPTFPEQEFDTVVDLREEAGS
jgi:DnaJ-domain-containing protein 1